MQSESTVVGPGHMSQAGSNRERGQKNAQRIIGDTCPIHQEKRVRRDCHPDQGRIAFPPDNPSQHLERNPDRGRDQPNVHQPHSSD